MCIASTPNIRLGYLFPIRKSLIVNEETRTIQNSCLPAWKVSVQLVETQRSMVLSLAMGSYFLAFIFQDLEGMEVPMAVCPS